MTDQKISGRGVTKGSRMTGLTTVKAVLACGKSWGLFSALDRGDKVVWDLAQPLGKVSRCTDAECDASAPMS